MNMSSKYANNFGVKYMYDLRQRADLVVGVTFAKHYVCMCTSFTLSMCIVYHWFVLDTPRDDSGCG